MIWFISKLKVFWLRIACSLNIQLDNLPLPKHVTDVVSMQLNNVVMTYFDLFIKPSIVYDWDEHLSIL